MTTLREIEAAAADELGYRRAGKVISSTDVATVILRWNAMVSAWETDGATWRDEDRTIVYTGGAAEVEISSRPHDLTDVRRVDGTNEYPLARWERAEFASIPNKTTAGTPSTYSLRKTAAGLYIRLWPVPAADLTLKASASRVLTRLTSGDLDEDLDLPPEWEEAAIYGLATRLIGPYGTSQLDAANAARVTALAGSAYARALAADRPASYLFRAG